MFCLASQRLDITYKLYRIMKLNEAIKSLVDERGTGVIKSSLFINILNDLGAFQDTIAYKNVLRILISEGYFDKIEFYSNSEPEKRLSCLTGNINEVERLYGIKNHIAKSVIMSLAYGIGMIDTMPEISPNEPSIAVSNDSDNSISKDNAVNYSDHLCFRDVPIYGDSDGFAKKLIAQGYSVKEHSPSGSWMLNGTFAGISGCDILINNSEFLNSVVSVSVLLPVKNAWFSLKGDYEDLKAKFIKKYGKPENSYEFFTDPYYEGDGYEMSAFTSGNAYFMSSFNVDKGTVLLAILDGNRVIITYTDKEGSEKEESAREKCADFDL